MRRFIKVLAATALMVVLMSTSVSPAFAGPKDRLLPGTDKKSGENGEGFGSEYGCIQHGGNHVNCGWHAGTS